MTVEEITPPPVVHVPTSMPKPELVDVNAIAAKLAAKDAVTSKLPASSPVSIPTPPVVSPTKTISHAEVEDDSDLDELESNTPQPASRGESMLHSDLINFIRAIAKERHIDASKIRNTSEARAFTDRVDNLLGEFDHMLANARGAGFDPRNIPFLSGKLYGILDKVLGEVTQIDPTAVEKFLIDKPNVAWFVKNRQ